MVRTPSGHSTGGDSGEHEYHLGTLDARMTGVEEAIRDVRSDQSRIFQALDELRQSQAMMNVKMDQQSSNIDKFISQCSICRIDMNEQEKRLDAVERGQSTSAIKRKSEGALSPVTKPWNKSMGDLAGDIVYGGIKALGVAMLVVLALYAAGQLQSGGVAEPVKPKTSTP